MTEMNAWIMSSYLFYPHFLDTPEQESNYHSQAKSDLLPIFVNKVLLEHGQAHLSVYGCFPAAAAELLSTYNTDFTSHQPHHVD